MKHLLRFNESKWTKEDYYEEVSKNDYHVNRAEHDKLPFNDNELSELEKLAQEKGYDFSLVPGTKQSTIRFAHRDSEGKLIPNSMKVVYKYDDEWFMFVSYSNNTRYYKCDGFEGLIRCLSDLLS